MNGQQLIAVLKKNPLSSVCTALSVVVALLIYFRSDALSSAEADLTEKTALGKRYATNLTHGLQLKEHYEALVSFNKEIESRFVRVSQLPQNLQYFYKLETDTGVKMTVDQVTQVGGAAATAGKGALVPVAFSVSVRGDYSSVVEFLRRVESGAHFSRVLSCTVGATGVVGVDTTQPRPITMGLSLELLGLP